MKNAGKAIIKLGKETGGLFNKEYKNMKMYRGNYIQDLLPRIKYKSIDMKDNMILKVEEKIDMFKSLTIGEKKDIIISGLLWIGTIMVAGGGTDFQGGMPDLDIKIGGIGRHRNVFSHTILLGIALEFLLRFSVNLLKHGMEFLPNDKSNIWKYIRKISDIVDENENVLVSGMWVGLSIHLLKDANLGSKYVKPYTDIPVKLTMGGHQNIFAGNSFLSFIFGTES